jgi:acyl-CoA thioesterase-1
MRLPIYSLPCFVVVAALLSGCGGGGGGSSRSATAPIRVACVGDSITVGVGTSNPLASSYPVGLSKRLSNGYQVRNFGVSGATAMGGTRLPYRSQPSYRAALSFQPDVVIIALGTNDAMQSTSSIRARFSSDYLAIVNGLKTARPGARIYICRPPAFNPPEAGAQLENEILPLIAGIATSTGATVIDLYGPTLGKANYFSDIVHPNNDGAEVIAETVYQAIKQ